MSTCHESVWIELRRTVSPSTASSYVRDFAAFQTFLDESDTATALGRLLDHGPAVARNLLQDYRQHLTLAGLAVATINRRVSSLCTLLASAHASGLISWTTIVRHLRTIPYRDTAGPGHEGIVALLRAATNQAPLKAARDIVIIRLLYDLALRRGEVCALDVADVQLAARRLWICGKGHAQKVAVTLPGATSAALSHWLEVSAPHAGPLLTTLDPSRKGVSDGRLTGQGLWTIIRSLGARAGVAVRPHGLRHAAITRALDMTQGDVRAVRQFARHANVATTLIYDDTRRDAAGRIASLLASDVSLVNAQPNERDENSLQWSFQQTRPASTRAAPAGARAEDSKRSHCQPGCLNCPDY